MKVELLDHMGSDLSVVNAARVSFDKESELECVGIGMGEEFISGPVYGLKPADAKLIQFLARGYTTGEWDALIHELITAVGNWEVGIPDREIAEILREHKGKAQHWSPFAHTTVQLRIKAPIFVARQLGKHQVGLVWNEVSRRYVDAEPEFYVPDAWRKRAENVKQGSSEETVNRLTSGKHEDVKVSQRTRTMNKHLINFYNDMLNSGVCPEQARMILPQSMMTEWIWTGSMLAFARVCKQRLDPHAQKETQEVAQQINDLVEPLFPVSWKALMEN